MYSFSSLVCSLGEQKAIKKKLRVEKLLTRNSACKERRSSNCYLFKVK